MGYLQDSLDTFNKYSIFLKNKKVVVVGPASHMNGWKQGNLIDSYDIVVRLSKGYELDEKLKSKDIQDHIKSKFYIKDKTKIDFGSRIDILYQTLLPNWGNGIHMPIENLMHIAKWICASFPDKRHKGCIRDFIKYNNGRIPLHIVNKEYWESIKQAMGTVPSIGASAICDLLQFDIEELYITGFNFYLLKDHNGFFYYPDYFYGDVKHLKDSRPKGKHNHFKIFKYLKKLKEKDERIKCDNVLNDLIKKHD